jgi:hypothetical protein
MPKEQPDRRFADELRRFLPVVPASARIEVLELFPKDCRNSCKASV